MWEAKQIFKGHGAPVYSCAWDGTYVYSAAGDKFVTRWNIETGEQDSFTVKLDAPAYCILSFKQTLLVGLTNGTLISINLPTKTVNWERNFFGQPWFSLSFITNTEWVVAGDSEGNLLVLTEAGEKCVHLTLALGKIRSLTSFGNTLIVSGQDGKIRWFEIPTFNELYTRLISEQSIHSTSYFATKDALICGGKDGYLRIIDNQSKAIIKAFPAHYQAIYGVQRIGNQVLSVSMDKTIKLWNSESWTIEQRIERPTAGHTRSVNGVLVLNERHFITWSDDKTILLWENKKTRPAVEN